MAREQVLEFGSIRMSRVDEDEDSPLYLLAGRKLYVIGAQSGRYPRLGWRRTGFVVGKRVEERRERAAHLVNEMGGVWTQPIKVLDGLYYSIVEDGSEEGWELLDSTAFRNHFSHAEFLFEREGLVVERKDFVAEDDPTLYSTLLITNNRTHTTRLTLCLRAEVNIMPAWFAGWQDGSDELVYHDEQGIFVAADSHSPRREPWAVVFGAARRPTSHRIEKAGPNKRAGTLRYRLRIGAGETVEMPFLFVAENRLGTEMAQRRFKQMTGKHQQQLRKKVALYRRRVLGGVGFHCSEREFEDAFYCAKANLQLLMADLPAPLGKYFFAGVPEYVQLFGTDTCYSLPGTVASGFGTTAREALILLREFADKHCGRVPHEVTTNGRVFHPGNPQETPQFVIACWHYFRWTGDRPFLRTVFPLCEEALLDYVVAQWDPDLDFYPNGQSMVERVGADEENVDSVCYFCRALYCLADMAEALGLHESAERYRNQYADVLYASLNSDFWIESESMYADALRADHTPRLNGFWTVIVPLETELAFPDRALRVLSALQEQEGWLNKYGLVHTRIIEPTVWTLPNGILARVALRWGATELGIRELRNIASTARNGMLGGFEELIPEGLSFIQLWSPAIFIQGIVEGIFGLSPQVHQNLVELFPRPPADWQHATIERVRVGKSDLSMAWERREGDHISIELRGGDRLSFVIHWLTSQPLRITSSGETAVAAEMTKNGPLDVLKLEFALRPGEEITVNLIPREGQERSTATEAPL